MMLNEASDLWMMSGSLNGIAQGMKLSVGYSNGHPDVLNVISTLESHSKKLHEIGWLLTKASLEQVTEKGKNDEGGTEEHDS